MRKPNVLIAFGSKYGQTRKIAVRISSSIWEAGAETELWQIGEGQPKLALSSYDAIVIGSAVFGGKHMRVVEKFIRANRDLLANVHSAFFSVSGSAGGQTEAERNEAAGYIDQLVKRTGWSPRMRSAFGGALSFSKYGWFIRFVVGRVLKAEGKTVDPTRDLEFTDWVSVDRFARDVASTLLLAGIPEFAPSVAVGKPAAAPSRSTEARVAPRENRL